MFFFPFYYFGNGVSFLSYFIILLILLLVIRVIRGLWFSSYRKESYKKNYAGNYDRVNFSNAFFNGTFSMLAKLSSADGQITDQARRKVEQFMTYDLNLDPESYNYAVSVFNMALSSTRSFQSYADEFYSFYSNNLDILQLLIDIFYRVALVDGHMSAMEENMISYAARRFCIPESVLNMIKNRYGKHTASSSRYYSVLGLNENATESEIKSAYRKLIKEFHPDTVSQKGAGEQFKEYAKKRFQEVQQAYEEICKERGIK